MHLGDKLKIHRREKGLDQFQMAEILSISHRKYQDIEKTGIIQKVGDLAKIREILGESAQRNAQNGETGIDPTLEAIANLTKSIDRLVRTQETLSISNLKLATTNERLANNVLANSGGTALISQPSEEEDKGQRGPVEQTNFLDKQEIRLPKKRDQQKGSVKNEGR